MKNEKPDCFLSVAEVAEIIGLDQKTIRNYGAGTDTLTRIKLGRRTVFSFNDVQTWIAQQVRQAQDDKARQNNLTYAKAALIERKINNRATSLRLLK